MRESMRQLKFITFIIISLIVLLLAVGCPSSGSDNNDNDGGGSNNNGGNGNTYPPSPSAPPDSQRGDNNNTDSIIADSNLETAIREALNKTSDPITIADLQSLEALVAEQKGITNLSGLEHCTNLRLLNLAGNNISDIGILGGHPNL